MTFLSLHTTGNRAVARLHRHAVRLPVPVGRQDFMQTDDIAAQPHARAHTLADDVSVAAEFSSPRARSWLSGVLASSLDAVVVIDTARRIVLVNGEAERMFGLAAPRLLEQSVDMLLPARLRLDVGNRLDQLARARVRGRRLRTRLEFAGQRSDGTEFGIVAAVTRLRTRGAPLLVLILRETRASAVDRSSADSDLRKLAVSSQQKSELEKKRFSRELYDDLGQRLSVLKLDLDWLQANLDSADTAIPERIAGMQYLLDSVIARTRNIASSLRPPLLDDFGLVPAIEWMVDHFRKRTGIDCVLAPCALALRAGTPAEMAVYRLIQEGLLNIELHARATRVRVELSMAGGRLEVRIEDDGRGLRPGDPDKPGCHGLTAMRERVVILGGTMSLDNLEPNGLAIHASIPLDPPVNSTAPL